MNIEEQRKAFDEYIKNEYNDHNPIVWHDGNPIKALHLMLWNCWLASANREGFKLVPVEVYKGIDYEYMEKNYNAK